MNKYILGLGISGALAAHYYKDFKVIVPKEGVSGQLNLKYSPPKVLHYTKETKKLLSDLKIKAFTKRIKIGYFYDNKTRSNISQEQRQYFVNKKMNDSRFSFNIKYFKDTKLSVEKNYLDYYNIDFKKIFNVLLDKIDKDRIINKKVILIDVKNRYLTLDDYSKLPYEHLISTIPFPNFRYLAYNYDNPVNSQYLPTTYAYTKNKPNEVDLKGFDWVYFVDGYRATRVSKNNGIYVWEFSGDLSKDDVQRFLGKNIEILDHSIQRVGLIFSEIVKDIPEITFLGRLAQFSHHIKIQDIIKKLEGKV